MYVSCVTCCPDIGYTITTMSKFSTMHYYYLKEIARYLCLTEEWDINSKRTAECIEKNKAKFQLNFVLDDTLPAFPVDINQPKLMAFVDDLYANNR